MKHLTTLFLSLVSLSLCACNAPISSSSFASSSTSESSASSTSSTSVDESSTINVYYLNDFHGSILERTHGIYYEGGLLKVGGYLKAKKEADPNHTIIMTGGDMWQGSLESNDNYGELITVAMNKIGCDAAILGNHDFDYGKETLFNNMKKADYPFLATNINYVADNTFWGHSSFSTVVTKGGIKVGLIGSIGQGITTSITSSNVEDLDFVDPLPVAQKEATRLRNEEGCSLVIYGTHSGYSSVDVGGCKGYFDAIFTAHNHQLENGKTSDGVPYLEGACNGEYISHYAINMNRTTVVSIQQEVIKADSSWSEDSDLLKIESQYLDETFLAKANRKVGTSDDGFSYMTIANAECKAMYEYYKPSYPNLALAMANKQRADIAKGDFTYSDLYKATPFMNKTIITLAKGSDIKNQASINLTYTGDTTTYATLDNDTYYTIVIIDYILLHQSVTKNYDYFRSFKKSDIIKSNDIYPMDILASYFETTLGGIIASDDYSMLAPGMNIYR
jgi:2',3'-cyclic-nucleotide 2'-phosphodiesterase (5'-nucleotidase family)